MSDYYICDASVVALLDIDYVRVHTFGADIGSPAAYNHSVGCTGYGQWSLDYVIICNPDAVLLTALLLASKVCTKVSYAACSWDLCNKLIEAGMGNV